MAFIYKITNSINDKVYIGKTNFSIEKRWREHIHDLYRARCEKRPLYSAMILHGVDKFKIELLEKCSSQEASLREQYWIGYYKSFTDGYNATGGGDGKNYKFVLEEEIQEVVEKYNSGMNCHEIAKEYNCDDTTISRVLKDKGINIGKEKNKDKYLRSYGLVLTKGTEVLEFQTKEDALLYLESVNPVGMSAIVTSVNRVLSGSRKTYLGYYITKVE